jgi:hypothetical protein
MLKVQLYLLDIASENGESASSAEAKACDMSAGYGQAPSFFYGSIAAYIRHPFIPK